MQGLGTTFQHLPFYGDPDAYEASLRAVLELRVDHLLVSHAYLPQAKSHLSGPEVRLFLEAGLEVALGLDRHLLRQLHIAQRPLTTIALTERVCELFSQGGATALAATTVGAHLRRLVSMGELFSLERGRRGRLRAALGPSGRRGATAAPTRRAAPSVDGKTSASSTA